MALAQVLAILAPSPAGAVTTWDAANKGSGVVLSGASLVMGVAGATGNSVRSTTSKANDTGKFYAEMSVAAATDCRIGFCNSGASMSLLLGADNGGLGYDNDGNVYLTGSVSAAYATFGKDVTLGVAIDTAAGVKKLWWSKNGVWQGGSPSAGTGGLNYIVGPIFLAAGAKNGGGAALNCGQQPFFFPIPSGFAAWG